MRNAGQRDRRCERAIAPLGKYHSFPHSQPESESFALSFANCVGNPVSFTVANVRISSHQPSSNAVASFNFGAASFTYAGSKPSPQK
jgi:hypothetical protein